MATVSPIVFEHHKKADGTWNIKIRVSHKGKERYINTDHFVSKNQLTKKFKIKDDVILGLLHSTLARYRQIISTIEYIDDITVDELKDRLETIGKSSIKQIDFFKCAESLIESTKSSGQKGTAGNYLAILNSLKDFTGLTKLDIKAIDYKFLMSWEKYLRTERNITRATGRGSERTYSVEPLSDSGIISYMSKLRTMFNSVRDQFNDEDKGIILVAHYPFRKYKIRSAPLTKHRDRRVEELVQIRDSAVPPNTRAELARDLFMLSFYMCGMNAADIYELHQLKPGQERIEYNRAKTRNKRQDKSFISVKITPEAKPLLDKYAGNLQVRYQNKESLKKAIHIGLKEVSKITGIEGLNFYDARHSVGTIARNVCGFSRDDVAAALNHSQRTVTDIYIAPDWSIIDKVQNELAKLLKEHVQE